MFKRPGKTIARLPDRTVFVAAAGALVVAGAARSRRVEIIAKPLIILSVQAGLWRTRQERSAADNALLAVASTASLAGDWLMMEEEFAPTRAEADRWMVRGAGAFAVNHIAMIALALKNGARPRAADFALRAGGLSEGVALLATRRRNLLAPLGSYSALLTSASAVAASPQLRAADEANSRLPGRAELGGLSFLVSDAMILHRQLFFKADGSRAAGEAFVLASYCLAQRLLFDAAAETAARRHQTHR